MNRPKSVSTTGLALTSWKRERRKRQWQQREGQAMMWNLQRANEEHTQGTKWNDKNWGEDMTAKTRASANLQNGGSSSGSNNDTPAIVGPMVGLWQRFQRDAAGSISGKRWFFTPSAHVSICQIGHPHYKTPSLFPLLALMRWAHEVIELLRSLPQQLNQERIVKTYICCDLAARISRIIGSLKGEENWRRRLSQGNVMAAKYGEKRREMSC